MPTRQDKNKKIRKLAIQLKDAVNPRLAVLLTPQAGAPVPKITPLAEWAGH